MKRLKTLKSIADFMEGDVIVAVEPDHPLLLSGPDILLAVQGQLVAAYLPKAREVKTPDLLLARQLVTRLALPPLSRSVLLVEPSSNRERIVDQVYRDFDEVIDSSDHRALKTIVLDKGWQQRPERIDALRSAKKMTLLRFEVLYNYSHRQYFMGKHGISGEEALAGLPEKPTPVLLPSWAHRDRPTYTSLVQHVGEAYVSAASFRKGASTLEAMRPLCVAALRLDYDLDFGIPYLRTAAPNVMFSDHIPLASFDPLKPLRAAAFAGWAISVAESGEDARNSLIQISTQILTQLQ